MRKIFQNNPKYLLRAHQNAIKRPRYSSSRPNFSKQNQFLLNEIKIILQSDNWESILPSSKVPKKLNPHVIQMLLQENQVGIQSNPKKIPFLAITLCNHNLYGCVSLLIDAIIAMRLPPMSVFDSFVSCYKESFGFYDNLNPKVFEVIVDRYRVKGLLDEAVEIVLKNDQLVPSTLFFNSILKDLLNAKKLELFWKVCEEMEKKVGCFDVYAYTNMIKAYCMVGDIEKAKEVFVKMSVNGCEPSVLTYNVIIDGLCKTGRIESIDEAVEMKKGMISKGLVPNVYVYTTLVNGFCVMKRWEDARMVLDEMSEVGVEPNVVTYNALVNGFMSEGDVEAAFRVKDKMNGSSVGANLVVYNTLLHGLCKMRKMDQARELVNEMMRLGMKLDVKSYTLLVDGYCKVGRVVDAFAVVGKMKSVGFEPNAKSYGFLIIELCHMTHIQEGEKAVALMLEASVKKNLELDYVVYETLLSASNKSYDYKKLKKVLEVMKEKGVVLNESCYVSVIECLCRRKKMDEARFYMNEMMDCGLEPNAHIFGALINGYCKLSEYEEGFNMNDMMVANKYFFAMVGRGLAPLFSTYEVLIQENLIRNNIIDAFSIYRFVLSRKFFNVTCTHKVLLEQLIGCKNPEEAYGLMMELKKDGLVLSLSLSNSLVFGLCYRGKVKEACKLVEDGWLTPNIFTYNMLIKACFEDGNSERAKELFDEIKEVKGLTPHPVIYNTMIMGFCKLKDLTAACGYLDEMVQMDMLPYRFIYNALVNCCYKIGDLEKAKELSQEMSDERFVLTSSYDRLTYNNQVTERSQMGIL